MNMCNFSITLIDVYFFDAALVAFVTIELLFILYCNTYLEGFGVFYCAVS